MTRRHKFMNQQRPFIYFLCMVPHYINLGKVSNKKDKYCMDGITFSFWKEKYLSRQSIPLKEKSSEIGKQSSWVKREQKVGQKGEKAKDVLQIHL